MRSCSHLDDAARRHADRVPPAAWSTVRLHPVLPPCPRGIGRYDEDRPTTYVQPLFAGERTLHVGLDLDDAPGTPVTAFAAGTVLHAGYNPADGDYGHVLVTRHQVLEVPFFALWGHLGAGSIAKSYVGRRFVAGAVLGWLGAPDENGGWPPHLHLQLSWDEPETHDLPGAVRPADRERALAAYPDPRLVLGPLY